MKLTIVFLTTAFLNVSARGVSQSVSFSGKEVPIEKIFTEVEKQTGFVFLYTEPVINLSKEVTVTANNLPLEQFLKLVLKDQPLKFSIRSKSVIISPASYSNSSIDPSLLPPNPIRIKVVDSDGKPLAGASVSVKGGQNLGVTDAEGVFSADVSAGDVLIVSFVGYENQEYKITAAIAVSSDRQLVKLNQKQSIMDETVVIAYGTTSKRFQTGNVATVKAADIEKQPVQNPLLALQGRVPGIEVTQLTGLSGGGVTVRIQGRNSIESGLDPLIVIDGVPYPSQLNSSYFMEGMVRGGSPLNNINPSIIESIDVLKDADATAIYGSRAANGAILITTKKGKAGGTKFTIDFKHGLGKVGHFMDLMNTEQYMEMRREAILNDGFGGFLSNPAFDRLWPDLKMWDTTRYTDWQKTLIGKTAQFSNINANISGGSSTIQYLIGGFYNRQTTVFPGSFDDKIGGLHFSTNCSSKDQKLNIQLSGNYSYDQNHLPNVDLTSQILLEPNAPTLYNENGTLNWAPNAAGQSTWNNPLAFAENTEFNNTTKNIVSNALLSYRISPGLVVKSSFGYTNTQTDLYTPYRIEFYKPERRINEQRSASFGSRNMSSWIIEPQLTYSGTIGKGKVEGLLGTTIQKSSSKYLAVTGSGFLSDLLMNSLTAAQSITAGVSVSEFTRFNSLFGRLSYSWDSKYLMNLTARRDGSNKFGDRNKFHNFGSVGIGWIFSSEKWMQCKIPFLSFGKLRFSFGTTGNDQIPSFSYLSIYQINNPGILYQNSLGLTTNFATNPYLQWEETKKWSWGIDLGFLNDRLTLSANFSRNRSSNQLIAYVLPSVTGFSSITKNLPATIENKSWEFTLNSVNFRNQSFTWGSNFNLTIPRNELLSFPGIESTAYAQGKNGVIVGQPLGVIKAYPYAGVDANNGNYLVYDKDGNLASSFSSSIQQSVLISPAFSSFYGGLQNSFSYKNFQLDFLFQFVQKKGSTDMVYSNGLLYPGQFISGSSNQPISVLNRWKKSGDNTEIGRYSAFNKVAFFPSYSDVLYNYDASYVRLKNLSFSWQLPGKWLNKPVSKLSQKNVRLYFSGQNLFTITEYKGLDPETMSIGTLPPLKIWTMGVHLEL